MNRVWLFKDGEVLPLGGNKHRMRMGMLAEKLASLNTEVTWWHSTFDHFSKTIHKEGPGPVKVSPNYQLILLDAGQYKKNISPSRFRHHQNLGRQFLTQAKDMTAPDVIVCSHPIPDFAAAVMSYGLKNNVPVIIDVRDLWPDIFIHKSPPLLRPLVSFFASAMRRRNRWIMENAHSIVAVSDSYLAWGIEQAGRTAVAGQDMVLPIGFQHIEDDTNGDESIQHLLAAHQNKTIVTFVGSFSYSYDLETVAKVAVELWESGNRDLLFILAGDGLQMGMLKKYAARTENIHLAGWLNRKSMDCLLAGSDMGLVCCQSVPGTMPNKVSQYLAFGLPLLSSLEGDSEKLILDNNIGSSYQVGDIKALKAIILNLHQNPELLKATKQKAELLYRNCFNAERIYEKYAELVLGLVDRKPIDRAGSGKV